MSIFKDYGIVLQEKKSDEKDFLYEVFFKSYGILWVKRKKKTREKNLDIGNMIHCEIITSEKNKNFQQIGNIKIHALFESERKNYKEIELFLRNISYLKKNLPTGYPNFEIFSFFKFLISEAYSYQQALLLYGKLIALFGNLPENNPDLYLGKLLLFIHQNPLEKLTKIKDFSPEIEKNLEIYLQNF